MAIQTLETIKNWFLTGLKPTQAQFWDTWDSFRHKNDTIPVEDVEGIDELLNSKADKSDFKTINGESILGSGDIDIDGGGSQNLQQVLTKGNTYSTYGQNDYIQLSNQYAPGWQLNEMRLMPGGLRVEKSHGGNNDGILYAADNLGSTYTRSDYAYQTGFNLSTEGLLLKTNVSESGTGIIKSDHLSKLTDYQLPVETTEPSITLVSKVNGVNADINGNVILPSSHGDISLQSALENGTSASFDDNFYIGLMDGNPSARNVSWSMNVDDKKSNLNHTATKLSIITEENGKSASFYQGNGKTQMSVATTSGGILQTIFDLGIPTSDSNFTLPSKDEDGDYIIATTDDFKTINGESIIGIGDISLGGGAGLDATLAAKNHANSPIILSDYYVSPEYYQGLKLFASTGNTFLENHYSGGVTGFLELKPGNLGLWQAATDSSGNSASMEISGGGWGRAPEISFNKRIAGEYSLCTVKAADPSEIDDLTTKKYVDSKVIAKAAIDSPAFTGVPSVPTAPLNTNTTQVASTAFVNAAIENSFEDRRPYKIYTALLSQIEENDPTAIVLENTLGGEIVWTRMYGGTYKGTLQGAFTVDRTTVFIETKFSELAFITGTDVDYESNYVYLKTCLGPWDLSDGVLRKTAIEIKVYR